MQVTTDLLASITGTESAISKKQQAIEAEFAEYLREETPEEILAKITEKGVQSLLEQKIDQMKKEATERAMAARGVSEADLAAMEPEDRTALMNTIMKEVQEKIKEAFNEDTKRKTNIEVLFQSGPMEAKTLAQVQLAQDIQNAS